MNFEELVRTYQIKNKCSKAAAIRAIAREHPEEHEAWLCRINAKEQPAQVQHHEDVSSPVAQRKQAPSPGASPVVRIATKGEVFKEIEQEVKREAEGMTEEAKEKYCRDFLLGMSRNHAEGFRRDLASGKLTYASLYQMIREQELKDERGLLD